MKTSAHHNKTIMTQAEYQAAELNIINEQIHYSDKIGDTLRLLLIYIAESKDLLFYNGKVKSISLINLITFYKFAVLSYKFIKDLIDKWK